MAVVLRAVLRSLHRAVGPFVLPLRSQVLASVGILVGVEAVPLVPVIVLMALVAELGDVGPVLDYEAARVPRQGLAAREAATTLNGTFLSRRIVSVSFSNIAAPTTASAVHVLPVELVEGPLELGVVVLTLLVGG